MKNIITIVLFSISIISCGKKKEDNYHLVAICDKIIIQDTIGNFTANFLVSYKNPNDTDITLFVNSYAQSHINKEYEKIGAFLKFNNSDTPIGQFHPTNKLVVQAGRTLKVLYTYSEKYPNFLIDFRQNESYKSQLKDLKLYYKYDKALMNKIMGKDENQNYIKSDFVIDMSNAVIEFKKDINIEEAIRLVNGKINGQ